MPTASAFLMGSIAAAGADSTCIYSTLGHISVILRAPTSEECAATPSSGRGRWTLCQHSDTVVGDTCYGRGSHCPAEMRTCAYYLSSYYWFVKTLQPPPSPPSPTPPQPTPPPTALHYAVDGCIGGDGLMGAVCPATDSAAIRCCTNAGDCIDSICTSSVHVNFKNPITGSFSGQFVTFAQAETECAAQGGRLCSWSELNSDVCCNSGCGFDSAVLWTSDSCGGGSWGWGF